MKKRELSDNELDSVTGGCDNPNIFTGDGYTVEKKYGRYLLRIERPDGKSIILLYDHIFHMKDDPNLSHLQVDIDFKGLRDSRI